MTVTQLRAACKSRGLRGYSKLRKAELERMLAAPVETRQTVASLRAEAKRRGLRGYSRLTKAGLISLLASTARLSSCIGFPHLSQHLAGSHDPS